MKLEKRFLALQASQKGETPKQRLRQNEDNPRDGRKRETRQKSTFSTSTTAMALPQMGMQRARGESSSSNSSVVVVVDTAQKRAFQEKSVRGNVFPKGNTLVRVGIYFYHVTQALSSGMDRIMERIRYYT